MNASDPFSPEHLRQVLAAVEGVRHKLPEATLRSLAQEVLDRVARQRVEPIPATAAEIEELCAALLSPDRQAAPDYLLRATARGVASADLCLSHLSGAAARLGEMWDQDRLSFLEVTVAVSRIYALMRSLRRDRPLPPADARAATFISIPGEDHTLGVAMAAEVLRAKGWDIHLLVGLGHNRLVDQLAAEQPAILGISCTGRRMLPALTRLLVALRMSLPETRMLVCGQIDPQDVEIILLSGADGVAQGFDAAAAELDRLTRPDPA